MGRILFTPHRPVIQPYYPIHYGLYYNWWVGVDTLKLTSSDVWIVPTRTNFDTLAASLGGESVAGGKLKETEFIYWLSPNINATNEVGMNIRGVGMREYNGSWQEQLTFCRFWTSQHISATNGIIYQALYNSAMFFSPGSWQKQSGKPLTVFRLATAEELLLTDGTVCTDYIGNDLKKYKTVKIGNQVWIAGNLAETKFRNGDWIHGFDNGDYTPISNTDWAALTTAGCCAYNDDITLI